jgi:endonuclease YncB( thermonuclease family)
MGPRALLLAALLAPALAAAAEPRECLVVGVSDGDTITARCGEPGAYEQVKERFNGIDAPGKKQPFGQRAKEALGVLACGDDRRGLPTGDGLVARFGVIGTRAGPGRC